MKSKKPFDSKKSTKATTISLDDYIQNEYGSIGTPERDDFEEGYKVFEIGFLLQQARIEKGLTQEELAKKCGTNKGYISKVENNLKEVRLSTLKRIVEEGLGGKLEISIQL